MLSPDDRVERYHVESVIGEGGMAVVYRVRHETLGSLHALKVLTFTSPKIRDRVVQEGRIQAQLRHPNIVPVTDVLEVGGSPALVMPYVAGPTLQEWIQTHHPVRCDEASQLFRGIVLGIAEAHTRGLVHRDLKPANILLAENSQGLVPRITDFGIAKALATDISSEHLTRSGVAMGTPAYMAPEQVWNAKDVDPRADVFALGCILFELLAGFRAFGRPNRLETYNAITSGEYPPIESVRPDVPLRLVWAIDGCMVVDRDGRIGSCEELLSVLDGNEPHHGPPVRSSEVFTGATTPPEHALSEVPPSASGPTAVAVSTAYSPLGSLDEDAGLDAPADQARRRRRPTIVLGIAAVLVLVVGLSYLGLFPLRPQDVSSDPVVAEAPRLEESEIGDSGGIAGAEPVAPPVDEKSPPAKDPTPVLPVRAPPPPPLDSEGTLMVQSVPWSRILVDGDNAGTTPFNGKVPARAHAITLITEEGRRHEHTVEVPEEGLVDYCWDFTIDDTCS